MNTQPSPMNEPEDSVTPRAAARNAINAYHDAVQAGHWNTAADHRTYLLRWIRKADQDRAKALILDHQMVRLELMEARKRAEHNGEFNELNQLNTILEGYLDELLALEQ